MPLPCTPPPLPPHFPHFLVLAPSIRQLNKNASCGRSFVRDTQTEKEREEEQSADFSHTLYSCSRLPLFPLSPCQPALDQAQPAHVMWWTCLVMKSFPCSLELFSPDIIGSSCLAICPKLHWEKCRATSQTLSAHLSVPVSVCVSVILSVSLSVCCNANSVLELSLSNLTDIFQIAARCK